MLVKDLIKGQDVYCDDLLDNLNTYQVATLQHMQNLELGPFGTMSENGTVLTSVKSNIGILANKVGSGKTRIAIALCASKHLEKDRVFFAEIFDDFVNKVSKNKAFLQLLHTTAVTQQEKTCSIREVDKENDSGQDEDDGEERSLIVVPHSLVHQWKEEFAIMGVPFLDVTDWKPARRKKLLKEDAILIKGARIILASVSKWVDFRDHFKKMYFKRIVFDEVDTVLKSSGAEDIKSGTTWLISATYKDLRQKDRSLYGRKPWKHIHSNMELVAVTATQEFIDSIVSLALATIVEHVCKDTWVITALQSTKNIPHEMMQALKADDILSAVKMVGGGASTPLEFIKQFIRNIDEKRNHFLEKMDELQERSIAEGRNVSVAALETYRRKIHSLDVQEESLKGKIQSIPEGACPICFDTFENPIITRCCTTLICVECITGLIKHGGRCVCPMCRESIDFKKLTLLQDVTNDGGSGKDRSSNEGEEGDAPKTKKACVLKILQQRKDASFLIFSNHDGAFKVEKELIENGITVKKLSGTGATIQKMIQDHRSGKLQVLMINSKNMGSGLNLQYVDEIIIYHDVGKFLETQVIGRVCRMGRKSSKEPVTVHKLLYHSEQRGTRMEH
jgi:SNF2 family DNA or RNA helicase